MLAVTGIYQDGRVKLDQDIAARNPVRIIITFLEDVETPAEKRLTLSDFSFTQSRKVTENYKGSFSETLIEERRSEL